MHERKIKDETYSTDIAEKLANVIVIYNIANKCFIPQTTHSNSINNPRAYVYFCGSYFNYTCTILLC